MPTPLQMPKLGMAMTAGTLLRWLKAEGEQVQAGEVVAEIETDKAVAELEAPASGRMGRLLVAPDQQVPVGTLLTHILATGEPEPELAAVAVPTGATPAAAAAHGATAATDTAPPLAAPASTRTGSPGSRGRLTPLARRVARELGLEPDAVAAAFPSGRVTRDELERWAASQKQNRPAAAAPQLCPAPSAAPVRQPLTVMRATIARRMAESLRESAQLTMSAAVDVTPLVQFREQMAAGFEQEFGHRPTYTDFLVKAITRAVPTVPQVNARWENDAIAVEPCVHVGVAVALEEGLIVPVIRDAGGLTLAEISRRVRDLGERARQGRLAPGEASGSTITLTNLGMEGIDTFTPILNPPEAAILGAGRIRQVPVITENGQLGSRWELTLSLTIDHRVVDGAPGARFLRRIAELLAQPGLLLAR